MMVIVHSHLASLGKDMTFVIATCLKGNVKGKSPSNALKLIIKGHDWLIFSLIFSTGIGTIFRFLGSLLLFL